MGQFINQGAAFGAAKELKNVPEGRYHLKVLEVENNVQEKSQIVLTIGILNPPKDVPEPSPLRHTLSIIKPTDTEKQRNGKAIFQKRFFFLFGVPFNEEGFDIDALLNAEAKDARVFPEEYTDPKTNKKGTSMRIDLPAVPDEAIAGSPGRAGARAGRR